MMSQTTTSPKLSPEAINALPLLAYEGEVCFIKNKTELNNALDFLEKETLIGFDTESRPAFHKGESCPITLIQLAGEKAVVLIPLRHVPLTTRLTKLLANPYIIKTGVAIQEDMRRLYNIRRFRPNGIADLAEMACDLHLQARSLRSLTAEVMGFRISKSSRCSNWAKLPLTQKQITYAATDAWIGRELYLRLLAFSVALV